MSRINEIKDQLKTKAVEISEKIQESELYQKLSDKYQSLSPSGQKTAKILSVFALVIILLFYPFMQWQASTEFITQFEEKRDIIRNFFRTYRESGALTRLPPTQTTDSVAGSVRSVLTSAQLIPEQIVSINPTEPSGTLIPAKVISTVVEVKLAHLNIRQTVDIGNQLNNISQSVKVKDLLVAADQEKTGYFNVTYKLYSLKVPEAPIEAPPEPQPTKKNKNKEEGNE